MIENPRKSSKSHVFMEKLLFFLTVNTFKEHKNAKNQVTLQICDCPAYFTHMQPLAFQATAQILQWSPKNWETSKPEKTLAFALEASWDLHKIFWPVDTAA